jgi:hypothetical protein
MSGFVRAHRILQCILLINIIEAILILQQDIPPRQDGMEPTHRRHHLPSRTPIDRRQVQLTIPKSIHTFPCTLFAAYTAIKSIQPPTRIIDATLAERSQSIAHHHLHVGATATVSTNEQTIGTSVRDLQVSPDLTANGAFRILSKTGMLPTSRHSQASIFVRGDSSDQTISCTSSLTSMAVSEWSRKVEMCL